MKTHALLAAVIGAITVAAQPVHATPMAQAEITEEIIGKSLVGKRHDMTLRIRYAPSGAFSLESPMVNGQGTWQFAQRGLCFEMQVGLQYGLTSTTTEIEHEQRTAAMRAASAALTGVGQRQERAVHIRLTWTV